ncbi:MAG: GNAT family N-acetyltransferase [Clostridia bacterium]|nr:GNAT family N-acetyltransferase [Clostridia bacterium]
MTEFHHAPISVAALPLWLVCFPEDGEPFVRHLLSLLDGEGLMLYAEEDGVTVCQGLLLPLTLSGRRGYYLYAVCTHPAYRGRGYMHAFLSAARETAVTEGKDFLLLIPATTELSDSYRRHGFTQNVRLAADERGEHPIYRLPDTVPLSPFDGDFRALFDRYGGGLSFPVFCAALASLSDSTQIFYTEHGFCVLAKNSERECLTADKKTLSLCKICPSPYRALLCPLSDVSLTTEVADPLPR